MSLKVDEQLGLRFFVLGHETESKYIHINHSSRRTPSLSERLGGEQEELLGEGGEELENM
jgi:hypothetical protein